MIALHNSFGAIVASEGAYAGPPGTRIAVVTSVFLPQTHPVVEQSATGAFPAEGGQANDNYTNDNDAGPKSHWASRSEEYKAEQAARLRRLRAERPDLNRTKNTKWRRENRVKHAAHKAVEYALKVGKLQRLPCERCGDDKIVHAHHDDYSKPLSVMWLCPKHHRQRHRELDATVAAPSGEAA